VDSEIEERIRGVWTVNERTLDAIDAVTAPGFLNRNALAGTPPGPAGHRQVVERLWKAFPDAHFEIEHLASDGDKVIQLGRSSRTAQQCEKVDPQSFPWPARLPGSVTLVAEVIAAEGRSFRVRHRSWTLQRSYGADPP
jgi:hypothetical protein